MSILFFEKIGLLWQTGSINPAQEHFISNLIRMKLCVAIDSLPAVTQHDAKKMILFLPEWELHEIGLLTYYYIARKHGIKVFYLGQNVPFQDLVSVGQTVEPDILATYFVSAISNEEMKKYLDDMASCFSKQHILISGIQAANIDFEVSDYTRLISSASAFKQFVKTIV